MSTDLPISDIAVETGFYDQSHFTNQFVRHKGMPPSHYRQKFVAPAPERRARVESLRRTSAESLQ